jgi:hypothetical protein
MMIQMQTSYPVFESGQVLTSAHLNGLVDYLEQQDRLTRNKLIGIGIVCGLDVNYDSGANRIRISAGCAVTSEGYLLVLPDTLLTQTRPYTLPVPQVEEAPEERCSLPVLPRWRRSAGPSVGAAAFRAQSRTWRAGSNAAHRGVPCRQSGTALPGAQPRSTQEL